MKKILTFFKATTLLLGCLLLTSQNASAADTLSCVIKFAPSIRTFEYLAEGTNVSDIEVDEGVKSPIPIGFTFRTGPCGAGKKAYTNVQVSSNGWLKFIGTATTGAAPNSATSLGYTVWPGLAPFWGDLSGTGGTATYNTELLASGLKVFTMEWKNWRVDRSATSAGLSFQVKLYEGSDIVEFCYKRESGTVVFTGFPGAATIAYIDKAPPAKLGPKCFDFVIFTDVSATPVLNRTGAWGPGLTAVPPDNQVYQFYYSCCGKPSAGVIGQPDSVCQGSPFVAKLSGATPSPFPIFGIRYQWQSSASTTGPWSDILGATSTSQSFPGVFGIDTFLRVIVTCDSSNLTDTTPVKRITLITLPYNCYCYSSATADINTVNIGNFKLITTGKDTMINNGDPSPAFVNKTFFRPYTLNTGLRPLPTINRDSSYKLQVMGITKDTFAFSSSGVAVYIDYNHDGIYAAATELAAFQVLSGTSSSFLTNFIVPGWASLDTVGMRVIMKRGATTSADVPPCGGYTQGETEDYLVSITNPQCPGPISAGIAYIADTSMCYGYTTTVFDTSHGKNMSGFEWEWEYSFDNVLWANVIGSKFKDSMEPVVRQSTYYRLRTICHFTADTIYSNKVFIKLKQPYKCYCYSITKGQLNDSSDVSTFKIGTFTANSGGPHLGNPRANRRRTDYTDLPAIELYSETTYPIAVYHTLRTKSHADAKITVYMDFNHNLKYDGASEIIWDTVTTASNFYPHSNITIPKYVIPNVETGMRVVLNNDLGANNPNTIGCDEFESGEIEDYLVIFRANSTGIGELSNVDNLQIYPNPNNGQFTISFSARKMINDASVVVTNMTGQTVYSENFNSISNSFVKNVQLGAQASGVYFITFIADGQKVVNKLIIQ